VGALPMLRHKWFASGLASVTVEYLTRKIGGEQPESPFGLPPHVRRLRIEAAKLNGSILKLTAKLLIRNGAEFRGLFQKGRFRFRICLKIVAVSVSAGVNRP
jgi:hypothetical protein